VRDFQLADWPVSSMSDGREAALAALKSSKAGSVLLLDDQRRPRRWADRHDLARGSGPLDRVGMPVNAIVEPHATLAGALDAMVSSRVGGVVVVDGRGAYTGTVDMGVIMAAAETMRNAARERAVGPDVLDDDDPRRAEDARRSDR
jgi:osmoprotectant transport system ATP-binding protein